MSKWNSFLKTIGAIPVRPLEDNDGRTEATELIKKEKQIISDVLDKIEEINKKVTRNEKSIKLLHKKLDEVHESLKINKSFLLLDKADQNKK